MERVILFQNAVETLGYFSKQIAETFIQQGMDVFFVDYDNLNENLRELPGFVKKGTTALLTFNFIGVGGEDIFWKENDTSIWEQYEIPILNILVDHPLYYHTKLKRYGKGMKIFCIDREHVTYLKRFYPDYIVKFLPLGGNVLLEKEKKTSNLMLQDEEHMLPVGERPYDVVFTANYVPMEQIDRPIREADAEYQRFYRDIYQSLMEHPYVPVDVILEEKIRQEVGAVTEEDLSSVMEKMCFLDLCARTSFRDQVIRTLTDADLKVHVFGAGWEHFSCKKPWNLITNGRMISSADCVNVISNAKICLNVMPGFTDGAHDRVFTAMLQKAVSLTDDTHYLREEWKDGEHLIFYSKEQMERLECQVKKLLENPEQMQHIADVAYERASRECTWRERAIQLQMELNS